MLYLKKPSANELEKQVSKLSILSINYNPKSALFTYKISKEFASGLIVEIDNSNNFIGYCYDTDEIAMFENKYDAKLFSKYGKEVLATCNIIPLKFNPP